MHRRWTLRCRPIGPPGMQETTIVEVQSGPQFRRADRIEVAPVTEVEEAIEQRDHFRDLAVIECNRWNEATKERDALRAAIDEVLDEQIAALVHESAKEIEAER